VRLREFKSGREAILSKVLVDATGDADAAYKAGVPYRYEPPGSSSLEFRMGNVNLYRTYEYFKENPERYPSRRDFPRTFEEFERNWIENGLFYYPHGGGAEPGSNIAVLVERAIREGRYSKERGIVKRLDLFGMDGLASNNTVIINTGVVSVDDLDVRVESKAEAEARKACFYAAEFLRRYVPGFEEAFIIATAPSLGVRVTRWIIGEYTLTADEAHRGVKFPDVISVNTTKEYTEFDIPYRCMIPLKVDGLIIASGKSVSTDPRGLLRGMTTCM